MNMNTALKTRTPCDCGCGKSYWRINAHLAANARREDRIRNGLVKIPYVPGPAPVAAIGSTLELGEGWVRTYIDANGVYQVDNN